MPSLKAEFLEGNIDYVLAYSSPYHPLDWTEVDCCETCLQGDKKSTQQVNHGKTKPSFPKKSYWLPQGMGGN